MSLSKSCNVSNHTSICNCTCKVALPPRRQFHFHVFARKVIQQLRSAGGALEAAGSSIQMRELMHAWRLWALTASVARLLSIVPGCYAHSDLTAYLPPALPSRHVCSLWSQSGFDADDGYAASTCVNVAMHTSPSTDLRCHQSSQQPLQLMPNGVHCYFCSNVVALLAHMAISKQKSVSA